MRVYTCMYCRYIHCINILTHIYIYYNRSNYRLFVLSQFFFSCFFFFPLVCFFFASCQRVHCIWSPFRIGVRQIWIFMTRDKGNASILRCPFLLFVLFFFFFLSFEQQVVLSKKNSFSNSQYLVMDALAMGCIAKKKIKIKYI